MRISKQVLGTLQADVANMSYQAFGFALWATEHKPALDEEAEKLARMMTGQQDWNGVQAEATSYSGLAKRANKWLKQSGSTSLRIKEHIVNGDGTSIYILV